MFSCKFSEISRSTLFIEHLQETASLGREKNKV